MLTLLFQNVGYRKDRVTRATFAYLFCDIFPPFQLQPIPPPTTKRCQNGTVTQKMLGTLKFSVIHAITHPQTPPQKSGEMMTSRKGNLLK